MTTLGEQLTLHIKRLGMKRKEVAEKAGMTEQTLRSVLNDNVDAKLGTYMRVAQAINKRIVFTVE